MYIFSDDIIKKDIDVKEAIRFAETKALTSDPISEYVITKLISDKNAFSDVIGRYVIPGDSLKAYVIKDIETVLDYIENNRHVLEGYVPSSPSTCPCKEYGESLSKLVKEKTPEKFYDLLTNHIGQIGRGELGKYIAYTWDGQLHGVERTDGATLDGLYCIDRQLQTLVDNTKAFIRGEGANNVLLYGNSGCGKSTSVKALLNRFAFAGLRLVQIDKEHLSTLPHLLNELSSTPFTVIGKFIIFIDDLSFEEDDGDYKPLKTALEGRIEGQASNVLFYATSNRFHIINETWAQRVGNDIHSSDTRNERLSLSERFGIRIHFLSPNQNDYLKIVEGILHENGVEMTSEIRAEALKWEVYYNGKSGRTANQFVRAYLSGNLSK